MIIVAADAPSVAVGSDLAGQAAAVLPAVAMGLALVLTADAAAVGAVGVLVAAAHAVAINLDALLVGATVVRLARRLALAGRGIAILGARAVIVATADAAPILAREIAAVVPAVARRHALALAELAVAAGAVAVSVTPTYLGVVDLDAILVGALGS